MKRKTKFSLPSKYLLLLVTILCVAMIFITFTTDLATGPLKTVSGYVFVPIQNGINYIGRSISSRADQLQSLQKLIEENKSLQAQVDELTIENSTLQQDKYELARLRELYQLDEKYPSYNKVAARVTGKDPGNWFSTFIIDKGTNDGFKVNNNVIAGSGLVGIIIDVGPNWAKVRSIIDDSSNVSAMILNTSDRCIVTGDLKLMSQGMIRFSQLNDKDNLVSVGDKVVTSNISDKYLQGILIGYINEKIMDANNLTSSGYITPVVDFEHLEEVLVITDLKK
ncbi:rod shape-determining protein MreC [Candidatus Galacturonibacter soehngenii]|uniref:Cell shape-determining protein MreC n=1 Tax=Candidatus Galacturonatibacter soehngenii TaxID=2307010 RepID=A0A7V7QM04_9FIRM|nr:rod shape-determining protein MreC [Candidatus Galacturonibacter soehngenii]KAB1439629.1 rod shape-determining protein MreC [Candidatus Galacturonibacter soehngenii]